MISVLREEIYKLFIKKRILIPLLCVLVFSMYSAVQFRQYLPFNIAQSDTLYNDLIVDYLCEYKPQLHNELSDLLQTKLAGFENLSQNPYNELTIANDTLVMTELKTEISVLSLINTQLNYVKENPTQRVVIEEAPWDRLIAELSLDPVPILFMIMMGAYVYYIQAPTEMYLLIDSSYYGKKNTSKSKLLLLFVTILSLILLPEIVKLIICFPSSWNAPIQSHPMYRNSMYNLNLLQVYLLVLAIKTLGLCFITLISVMAAKLTRNLLFSIVFPIMIFVAPYYVLRVPHQRLWIPTNLTIPTWLILSSKSFEFSSLVFPVNDSVVFVFFIFALTTVIITHLLISKKV